MDQMNPAAWVGRSETQEGCVAEAGAQQIAATLDSVETPGHGDALPPLWHWCAFPTRIATGLLATDGHPPVGDFLPPSHLKRRMWAGGSLSFCGQLRVGDPLTQHTRIADVTVKEAASGQMMRVSVDREVHGPQGLAVVERQDIVYLNIPDRFVAPKKRALPTSPDFQATHKVNEALLFRFSAITFNAHRIHYDRPYAQDVEKYPDLVVHGPLQAMLLMAAATGTTGRTPCAFSFRGVHPMFLGNGLQIAGQTGEDGEMQLFTGQDGHQGMQATAIWEGTV